MNLLARLRSSSRGILVWMLLAAYVCTPLAAWAQPRPRDIVVPFCTAQKPAKSPAGWGTQAPGRIVLRFAGHAQVAASAVQFALPAAHRASFGGARDADFVAMPGRAPSVAPPLGWRPPPRAPPAAPARS